MYCTYNVSDTIVVTFRRSPRGQITDRLGSGQLKFNDFDGTYAHCVPNDQPQQVRCYVE